MDLDLDRLSGAGDTSMVVLVIPALGEFTCVVLRDDVVRDADVDQNHTSY
jgi:hypothetical protein